MDHSTAAPAPTGDPTVPTIVGVLAIAAGAVAVGLAVAEWLREHL
jgi:predicted phosphoribosyltransferase